MSPKFLPVLALIVLVAGLVTGCTPPAAPTLLPTTAPVVEKPTPIPTTAPATEKAPPPTALPVPTQPESSLPGVLPGADLKVTGLVDTPIGWKEAAVKEMESIKVDATNKNGQKSSYSGVLFSSLLKKAGPQAGAKTVVLIGSDGFQAETGLEALLKCSDCIVSFRDKGGFSAVLPGQASDLQVKGLVEIQIK